MTVSVEDVRDKNKSLLLTDGIADSEIQTAISEATIHLKTRMYESLDSDISDSDITVQGWMCVKLLAASYLIRDNYSDNEKALELAKSYYSEANTLITAMVKGSKKTVSGEVKFTNKAYSYQDPIDVSSSDYRTKIRDRYR
jgi:hypothetical protein